MRSLTLRRSALATALAAAVLASTALPLSAAGPTPPDGLSFLLGDAPQESQSQGASAMAADGSHVVVWKESSPGGERLLARLFPASGVGDGTLVEVADGAEAAGVIEPRVVMAGTSGYWVVAWTAQGLDGDGAGAYARLFDAAGTPQGAAFALDSEAAGHQSLPHLAMSENGFHYAAAWHTWDDAGRSDIRARPFALNFSIADAVQANLAGAPVTGAAQVAMGEDDAFTVFWLGGEHPGDSARRVMARRFDRHGVPLDAPIALTEAAHPVDTLRVGHGAGLYSVLYTEQGSGAIVLRTLHSDLTPDHDLLIATTNAPGAQPRLAMNRRGDTAVAWRDGDPWSSGVQLNLAVYDEGGGIRQQEQFYPDDAQLEFHGLTDVAIDVDGDLVTVWESASMLEQQWKVSAMRTLHDEEITLQLSAAAPATVNYGDWFGYTITAMNLAQFGWWPGEGATSGFTAQIQVPDGAEYQPTDRTDWSCDAFDPPLMTIYCTYLLSLERYAESRPLYLNFVAPPAAADLESQVVLNPRHLGYSHATVLRTAVRDYTADAFAFEDRSGVARSAWQESNEITVGGIEGPVQAFVSFGEFSVNDAAWSTAQQPVQAGDRIRVRHQSAAGFGASIYTTLNLGGVADTFSTTTELRDTSPDAFAFVDQGDVNLGVPVTSAAITVTGINDAVPLSISGGSYSLNGGAFTSVAGTARAGDTIRVQHTAALTPATATHTVLTVGGVSDTFTSTTVAPDTTPDAFAFGAQSDVPRDSERTSAEVQISGINTAAPIGVTGGSYSINGGAFTSAAGTITNGQFVRVRHTAASAFSTATTTQLTIGGTSGSFTSTTLARDVTPDAFAFAPQADVPRGSERTSAEVTIAGINDAAPVSVAGGSYSIDGGVFTSAAGTIANGQRLRLRHTAAAGFSATATTTVTVGTANAAFSSTTEAQDAVPDAFAFVDRSGLATAVESISAPVTVAGINAPAPVAVSGGSYSVNGGAFTTAAGTVQAGDAVRVRHVTASSASTAVSTTLTIGGVSDAFTSTTGASDSTPNAYAFADVGGAKRNKAVTSAPITVAGINVAVPISVAGGGARWSKNGGAFGSAAGTVVAGDQVRLQLTAPNASNFTVNVQVSIGGVADTWTVSGN